MNYLYSSLKVTKTQYFIVFKNVYRGSQEEIVAYARSKIGQIGYNLLNKNCQHFAYYCRYGIERSYEVSMKIKSLKNKNKSNH